MRVINQYKLTISKEGEFWARKKSFALKTIRISLFMSGLFIIYSLFINPAFAATPLPTATDSAVLLRTPVQVLGTEASPAGVLTSTIDLKLEDLKREIASKAAQLKSEVTKKIGNKAIFGKVNITSNERIVLDTKNGSRTIKVNEYTIYQNDTKVKLKKALTFAQIQSGESFVALGDMDETGTMVAKKIVKVDPVQKKNYQYLSGQISEAGNLALVLSLRSGEKAGVNFSSKTIIQNDKSEGTYGDLKTGKRAMIILNGDEASQSAYIYLPPESSLIKPKP